MLKAPPHLGLFVREEIIDAHNLSVSSAALHLGMSRAGLTSFLNGKTGLTPALALRIEKAFGVKMDTLMRMQTSYDIAQQRRYADAIIVAPFSAAI